MGGLSAALRAPRPPSSSFTRCRAPRWWRSSRRPRDPIRGAPASSTPPRGRRPLRLRSRAHHAAAEAIWHGNDEGRAAEAVGWPLWAGGGRRAPTPSAVGHRRSAADSVRPRRSARRRATASVAPRRTRSPPSLPPPPRRPCRRPPAAASSVHRLLRPHHRPRRRPLAPHPTHSRVRRRGGGSGGGGGRQQPFHVHSIEPSVADGGGGARPCRRLHVHLVPPTSPVALAAAPAATAPRGGGGGFASQLGRARRRARWCSIVAALASLPDEPSVARVRIESSGGALGGKLVAPAAAAAGRRARRRAPPSCCE